MDDFSFVANSDISSIEELYRKYTENPKSVDSSFASFFKGRLPHKGKTPPNFLDPTRVCYITSFYTTLSIV